MTAGRLLSVLLLPQSRGRVSARGIADELGVSVRTAYRDLAGLQASGVPVYAEPGRAGGYQLLDGYRTRLTGMSQGEARALFFAGLPGPAADLGLSAEVTAARLKLLAALPAALRDEADHGGVPPGDERFDRPRDFDLGAHWTSYLDEIPVASLHRHSHHPPVSTRPPTPARQPSPGGGAGVESTATTVGDDGWIEAVIPTESTAHACGELLRLGVEVVALAELRQGIAETVAALAGTYGLT
ncbi:HTH domain-containing protein [Streptomyces sp. NPDC086077]|uniref:helix-turn-helix transcriptional regulator n=1 Tax=Streptomyces sp. NPDC086077 TaxID=3154862 RepID=UPI00341E0B61